MNLIIAGLMLNTHKTREEAGFSFFKIWKSILRIGYDPALPGLDRNRIIFLNGLTAAVCVLTFLFAVYYRTVGFSYYYVALYFIPPGILLFYLHHRKKYQAAKILYAVGSLLIIGYWCYKVRRIGNEYVLIGLAVTSTLIFSRRLVIWIVNFMCIGVFISYKMYDASIPFVPDPSLDYEVIPVLILFSTVGLLSYQMAFFRDLTHHYDDKFYVKYRELNDVMELQRKTSEELTASNENLKLTNEQLQVLTNQLEHIVKQKSMELQSYIDAINVNIYSAGVDSAGNTVKINEPLLKETGYDRDELLGRPFDLLNSEGRSIKFWENHKEGHWRGEIKGKRKDGSFFWADVVILPIVRKNNMADYFLVLALPITERKLYEASREKTINVLERIAFNTSHDIRGPITRIQGLANLVQKDFITPEEFKEVANQLIRATEELNRATSDLVWFVNTHSEKEIAG